MKIVAFSDIHGNQYAFRKFLKELKKIDYDKLVFCGDVYGYYYGEHEIIDKFKNLHNFYPVRGNHDQLAINVTEGILSARDLFDKYGHSYGMIDKNDIEFIRGFPIYRKEDWEGLKIGIMHGMPSDYLNGRIYPKDKIIDILQYEAYDIVICGHTHFRMVKQIDKTTIINVGSLGQQRDGKGFCYAEIILPEKEVYFHSIKYDMSELEQEIRKNDFNNEKLISILHRGE
ncbi:MAG: metallophosphatase family protein [Clostridium sp.]|nr:metallophosphatase family protein [Clostridium sp.]